MRYRVAFAKREHSDSEESSVNPSAELDLNLDDDVVAEKVFVEQLESEARHSQEVLDEDDAFLGIAGQEVWEYEVVDSRAKDFEAAIENSDLVLEYDVVDSTPTTPDEIAPEPRDDLSVYPPDGGPRDVRDATAAGSGRRAGDDGPAGMPTADPSAGGLNRGVEPLPPDEAEEFQDENGGGIDELHVRDARDPKLGLTDRGRTPPDDWAANTGPTRNPDRGKETASPRDNASTLTPRRRTKRR